MGFAITYFKIDWKSYYLYAYISKKIIKFYVLSFQHCQTQETAK